MLDAHTESQAAVQKLLKMRLARKVGDPDLELPYHAIIVKIVQVRPRAHLDSINTIIAICMCCHASQDLVASSAL